MEIKVNATLQTIVTVLQNFLYFFSVFEYLLKVMSLWSLTSPDSPVFTSVRYGVVEGPTELQHFLFSSSPSCCFGFLYFSALDSLLSPFHYDQQLLEAVPWSVSLFPGLTVP
ncbi:UNVERIFIED_CONTAM: hypothetical protein K2H54_047396 [Gekko kuhli]